MDNPVPAPDQTALLIAQTAAWSHIIDEANPQHRSDGASSTGLAVPVADQAVDNPACSAAVDHTSPGAHPALGGKVQEMNRPSPTTSPSSALSSSPRARLSRDAARTALRAARYAVAAYPGPIGELISRELHSYVDAGEQVHAPALAARLMLALQRGEAQNPLPPIQSDWRHLPAQYIPGSPMHWRYQTIADDTEESNPDNR